MRKSLIIAAAAAAIFSACGSTQKVGSAQPIGGEWTVEKIEGVAIDKNAGDEIPFLGFDENEKRVYGSTGCNALTGELNANNGRIDFGSLGCTRMMCADMTNERKVLDALQKVKKYQVNEAGNLELTTSAGSVVMELAPKK